MPENLSDKYIAIVELHGRTVIIEGDVGQLLEKLGRAIERPREDYPGKVWSEEVRIYKVTEEVELETILGDNPLKDLLYKALRPELTFTDQQMIQ